MPRQTLSDFTANRGHRNLKATCCGKVCENSYLEVIEFRAGNILTMPTMNSVIKTIISGRRDVIHKYLPGQINPDEVQRIQFNPGKDGKGLRGNRTHWE